MARNPCTHGCALQSSRCLFITVCRFPRLSTTTVGGHYNVRMGGGGFSHEYPHRYRNIGSSCQTYIPMLVCTPPATYIGCTSKINPCTSNINHHASTVVASYPSNITIDYRIQSGVTLSPLSCHPTSAVASCPSSVAQVSGALHVQPCRQDAGLPRPARVPSVAC